MLVRIKWPIFTCIRSSVEGWKWVGLWHFRYSKCLRFSAIIKTPELLVCVISTSASRAETVMEPYNSNMA